jgi:drug/metabolite transporter (DMT)-like permease
MSHSPPVSSSLFITIFAACGAVLLLFMTNVFAKLIADIYTPMEMAFWRNALSALILIPFVLYRFGPHLPPMGQPKTMATRAVLGSVTLMLSIGAYVHLPLADANAIILSAPLILTLLAGKFLKEHVTRTRLACTVLGLSGVLLVAMPSGYLSLTGTVLAVAAALSVAMMRMLLRKLGKTEDPLAMTFYFLGIGTLFTALLMPILGQVPPLATLPVLLLVGVCGALGQYLNAVAYKMADASFVGIFVYTQLLWAIPFDYFLWDHAPHAYTLLGGSVILAANIAVVIGERRQRKSQVID